MQSVQQHCLNAVRTSDWEGYVSSLFVLPRGRDAVFAVRAFNCEVAAVRDSVARSAHEETIAKMRFKFWRDLVDGVYANKPINHHVAQSLAAALDQGAPLSKQFLHRIISAREADFTSNSLYPTTDALEKYAEQTQSSLLYLQLEACGVQNYKVDHIASHIGKAIGIATVLRSTPVHVPNRQLYLPSELMTKHNLSSEDVFRSGPSEKLADIVFELASLADNHLYTARAEIEEMKEQFPQIAVPALLPAIACDNYLKRLESVQFDVFNPRLRTRNWKLLYNLWKHNRSGKL